ncbi:MAG: hypothetical protein IPG63_04375 [Xanthomonadales bacterium]|nr:hypothetical protein [Xanthomonadales bacterium]MBK7144874.1 hypothetical protein [Xanthomonadales bacterium]MCC6560085.1 hypothetical protein [Xanthomonadales bacterium]
MRSRLLLLSSLLLPAIAVEAATSCVSTVAGLQSALSEAENNGEDDHILIATGTYAPGTGTFAFDYRATENRSLRLTGGYVLVGASCLLQALDPALTVLSGSGARSVLRLAGDPGTSGNIRVEALTIRDGHSTESGGGGTLGGVAGFNGDVVIDRVIVRNNDAELFGGGLSVSTSGTVSISNSFFLANRVGIGHSALTLTLNTPDAAPNFIVGNTLVANGCLPASSCNFALRAGSASDAEVVVANNALAFNGGDDDLRIDGPLGLFLYRNNFVGLSTNVAPEVNVGNLALTNPDFVDPFDDDYRLLPESPLRNAGHTPFVLTDRDLDGLPRINGADVDIGAYESRVELFSDGFDQDAARARPAFGLHAPQASTPPSP